MANKVAVYTFVFVLSKANEFDVDISKFWKVQIRSLLTARIQKCKRQPCSPSIALQNGFSKSVECVSKRAIIEHIQNNQMTAFPLCSFIFVRLPRNSILLLCTSLPKLLAQPIYAHCSPVIFGGQCTLTGRMPLNMMWHVNALPSASRWTVKLIFFMPSGAQFGGGEFVVATRCRPVVCSCTGVRAHVLCTLVASVIITNVRQHLPSTARTLPMIISLDYTNCRRY